MSQRPALKNMTSKMLHHIAQSGQLASCMVRVSLKDLNSKGPHRTQAHTWFLEGNTGGASLETCCSAIANLNRFLSAYAPAERAAIPHFADIMPDDVQDPNAWKEKLQKIAQIDSLDPDAIYRRTKAAYNIECLADALVDECREVFHTHTREVSIQGSRPPSLPEDEERDRTEQSRSNHGPILRL